MRERKSKIWFVDRKSLIKLVKNSNSLSAIIKSLGLSVKGTTNFTALKRRLAEEKIDYEHIRLGLDNRKGQRFLNCPKRPLCEFLVQNSNCSRSHLKKRLIKEGILEYKCSECNIKEWQNLPIALQLDHINGVPDDNRLCNLRLLCPNCHSQTKNFGGRGIKRKKIKKKYKNSLSKRPSFEELKFLLWKIPSVQIAKRYKVSDKTIEKWAKYYDLPKPPRGYWTKVKCGII